MKQIRSLTGGLVACGIALAMATSLSAQPAQQGMAKVVNIKGSARYMSAGSSTWQPLRNGAVLKPGTIVQTASGSYVDIVLNSAEAGMTPPGAMSATPTTMATGSTYQPKEERDAVRIFENTVLGIDKLTVDQTGVDTITETQFDLKAGSLFGTVKKLSAGSKYEVKIPNGVAGIRGTIYYISASGVLQVLKGAVMLAWVRADGTVATQEVTAGQQFDIRTGVLSTISSADLARLRPLAGQLHFVKGRPVIFIPEPIYYVSGVHGQNGRSGGPQE